MRFGLAGFRRWLADRRSRRDLRDVLDFLDGKSVAVVGNAASLLSHRHGALIDRHDVVVRMNMGFPVDAVQGTRFDLWCFFQPPRHAAGAGGLHRTARGRDRQSCQFECRFYPISYWQALHDKLGAQPSVGAMTVDLVSRANPRQVTIIGFDFNRSKTFYETRALPSPHDFAAEECYLTGLIARRSWHFVAT